MESYKGVLHVAQMGTSRHFWTSSGRYLMKLIAETGRDFMRVFFREVLDFLLVRDMVKPWIVSNYNKSMYICKDNEVAKFEVFLIHVCFGHGSYWCQN